MTGGAVCGAGTWASGLTAITEIASAASDTAKVTARLKRLTGWNIELLTPGERRDCPNYDAPARRAYRSDPTGSGDRGSGIGDRGIVDSPAAGSRPPVAGSRERRRGWNRQAAIEHGKDGSHH